jgi:hypothetical protein
LRSSDKVVHDNSNEQEVKTTLQSHQMSESMTSSLGVLDLEDPIESSPLDPLSLCILFNCSTLSPTSV